MLRVIPWAFSPAPGETVTMPNDAFIQANLVATSVRVNKVTLTHVDFNTLQFFQRVY